MRFFYPVVSLIAGFCIGLLVTCYFANNLNSVIGVIGTLSGTILGAYIGIYFSAMEKRDAYIAKSQNVLLIANKQHNELLEIKRTFDEYNVAQRHITTPPVIISPTVWRLSKQEVLGLNKDADKEIISIIYDLIFYDKNFRDLLLAIKDYNKYKDPIVKRIQDSRGGMLSGEEVSEMKRYLDAVYRRLEKIDFLPLIERLHRYLKGKFPKSPFPEPDIKK